MTLLEVGAVFGWIGVVSFGGGLAVVPEMSRQLVTNRGWLDARTFADGYAVGQLSPGPNFLSVVFYGYALAGIGGATLALLASFLPGALVATTLGLTWARMKDRAWLAWIRRGLVPVGAGLMAAGVFVLGKSTLTSVGLAVVAVAVTVVVEKRMVNHAVAVAMAGVIGVIGQL